MVSHRLKSVLHPIGKRRSSVVIKIELYEQILEERDNIEYSSEESIWR